MPFHDLTQHACPVCKVKLNAVSNAVAPETRAPIPGDATICVECTSVLVFTDTLAVRKCTEEDWQQIPPGLRLELEIARIALTIVKREEKIAKAQLN